MPYPLLTARLAIEPLVGADLPAFVAYRQAADVARWQSWSTSYSLADGAALLKGQPATELPPPGGWLQLAIRPTGSPTLLLGDVAVHRLDDQPDSFEIGFTLAPESQGRGFGAEAVAALLRYLFDDAGGHAHRVAASTDARNTAAAALLRRVGMRHEGTLLEADHFKGAWASMDGWAMLAREHRALAAAPPAGGAAPAAAAGTPGL